MLFTLRIAQFCGKALALGDFLAPLFFLCLTSATYVTLSDSSKEVCTTTSMRLIFDDTQ